MVDLPRERLDEHVFPCTHTGVGYFGPIKVKFLRRTLKNIINNNNIDNKIKNKININKNSNINKNDNDNVYGISNYNNSNNI